LGWYPLYPLKVLAQNRIARFLAVVVLALPVASLPLAAVAATPITGVVTDRTTNKPAAGDTVVLIRLAQGMQEATHTTTDAKGHYTLDVPDAGLHLVRVTHDKANYFQPAPEGSSTVDVDVYSSAPVVKGVTTEAIVMRVQTDASGSNLNVVENFFIKNDSKPPTTQFSNEPFDFYLPDGAIIEGSAALAPGGMPLKNAPVPLGGGKYTFLFPIRPGETRFQVTYHLPYSGKFSFPIKLNGPTGTVAVILPKAITFQAAAGSPYGAVEEEAGAQTYVAQGVTPEQPLGFQLSGKGELPRDNQNPDAGPAQPGNGDGTIAATDNKAPGKGLDNPLDPEGNREPLSKYKWWILGGLLLLLAAVGGVLLRKPSAAASEQLAPLPTAPLVPLDQHALLLQALKEELFALETDRLQGHIAESDYLEQKAAIELILRRALNRAAKTAATPDGAA
jgi:hypothetical protein